MLGMIGRLFFGELFIVNFILSIILILVSRPGRKDWLEPFRFIGRSFRALGGFCRRPEFLIFLLLDVILLLLLIAKGIIYPPYSWDGVHYHLGQVGLMIQDGGLGFINSYPLESYPRNIELTSLWHTIFTRHQMMMNCIQIPYILLAMLACYGILRKAGCLRHSSAFAAMIFPTLPIVFQQATTGYIDIAIAACILCAINFLLVSRPRIGDVILAGLSLGLLIGGKGSGVSQAVGLVFVWMIVKSVGISKRDGFKRFLLLLAVLIAASLLNGIYMYVRNWILFGNPVHPYDITIAGLHLFDGTRPLGYLHGKGLLREFHDVLASKSWLGKMFYTWSDPRPGITYDGRQGGFGPTFFVMFLPLMTASFLAALLQRNRRFIFALVMVTIPLLAIHNLSWWSRYIIHFSAAGMLGFAYIDGILRLSDVRRLLRYTVLILAIASCFLFFHEKHPGLKGLKHYLDKGPAYWHASQFSVEGLRMKLYRKIYPYERPGTTIMVDHSLTTYWEDATGGEFMCLWNLEFSNRVVYAGVDNRTEWFNMLEGSGADFVFVGNGKPSYQWVNSSPDRFEEIATDGKFTFYRVKLKTDAK